jgi:cytochrome c oxidase cbb3-type subunit I
MAFHGFLFLIVGAVAAVLVRQISFHDDNPLEVDSAYTDGPIKVATIAALFCGIAGFVVGDFIAWQLTLPGLNFDLPWTSFWRLRPLHTSAVIFCTFGLGRTTSTTPRCPTGRRRSA